MKNIISKLILYGNRKEGEILFEIADIFDGIHKNTIQQEEAISAIYKQIKNLLNVATDYGFDQNLWQNYLTFFLIMNENPFSITCEKTGEEHFVAWVVLLFPFLNGLI